MLVRRLNWSWGRLGEDHKVNTVVTQTNGEAVSRGCVQIRLGDGCSVAWVLLRDDEAEGEVGTSCLVFSLLFPSYCTSGVFVWMDKLIFGPDLRCATGNGT